MSKRILDDEQISDHEIQELKKMSKPRTPEQTHTTLSLVNITRIVTTIESQKEDIARWNTIRPEVQWFAEQMELALRDNEHKGGWEHEHQSWLLGELFRNAGKIFDSGYNIKRVVNVANFAMMIADNARNGGKPNETNLS